MSLKTEQTKTITPKYRYAFKAVIIGAGHRTLSDFSNKLGVPLSRLSRIVAGWDLPGPHLQRKIAGSLGITLGELQELLK